MDLSSTVRASGYLFLSPPTLSKQKWGPALACLAGLVCVSRYGTGAQTAPPSTSAADCTSGMIRLLAAHIYDGIALLHAVIASPRHQNVLENGWKLLHCIGRGFGILVLGRFQGCKSVPTAQSSFSALSAVSFLQSSLLGSWHKCCTLTGPDCQPCAQALSPFRHDPAAPPVMSGLE